MKTCYLNVLGMICSLGANLGDIKRNLLDLAHSGVANIGLTLATSRFLFWDTERIRLF